MRRRRNLTPCLLFRELNARGGGLARGILERSSLYARHYEQVVIFTTSLSPNIDAIVTELRQRGSLDERVTVRNFFQHSSWVQSLGAPPTAALSALAHDGVVSKRQRMPGGPFLRIADREAEDRLPYAFRYFDHEGRPLVTTRPGPGSKHEQFATFHKPEPREANWGRTIADWVDEEMKQLINPVLFSMQRAGNDPALIASKQAVRKVASLHNCHLVDPQDPTSGIRGSFRPVLYRPRAVDQIICLTEQQFGELQPELRSRELETGVRAPALRAIPYPGRPPREEPGPKDPLLVVLVAQLIERKRVDHAIRAFVDVLRAVPGARLEIYGEGPADRDLQRLIEDLGLQQSVALMGYSLTVNRAQARAMCTLMTSTFEGYARIISESMSLGTPVIAYDVRYGPRDLIRHEVDGLLVSEHKPAALAEAIVQMLTDPERAIEMGVRASEVIDRLPVEDFERAWLDVLDPKPTSVRELKSWVFRHSPQARRVRRVVRALVVRPQPPSAAVMAVTGGEVRTMGRDSARPPAPESQLSADRSDSGGGYSQRRAS